MNFLHKPIENIEPGDIEFLLKNSVCESKVLDYKRELPGDTDGERKEFLADVSAFANTAGGVIVFGIEEKKDTNGRNTGIPGRLTGVKEVNFDHCKQRLEQIIRGGLDPKLNRVQFREIQIGNKYVFLLRIPRSLFAPHVVWLKRSGRFFFRTNSGKEQMDVREIKQAFQQTNEWERQALEFRQRRIRQVSSDLLQPSLDKSFPCFLHILPIGSPLNVFDINDHQVELQNLMQPFRTASSTHRYNLDGFLKFSRESGYKSYIQYFRNGGVEVYVSGSLFVRKPNELSTVFYGGQFEKFIFTYCTTYLEFARKTEVQPPLIVGVSCFGLKGIELAHSDGFSDGEEFDRDEIWLPEVWIQDYLDDYHDTLQPILDSFWQAGGWSESPIQT